MADLWKKLPRTFKICILASVGLLIAAGIVCGFVVDVTFAVQTIILGGFSFALLCAYVVWTSSITLHVKMQADGDDDTEKLATSAALKIQVASFVRLIILAAFLVTMVLACGFSPVAALVGVSVIYIPLYIVPLFVKPAEEEEDGTSEAEPSEAPEVKQP